MKKLIVIFTMILAGVSLAFADGNKTLIEQGLSLASLMHEMASNEEYAFNCFGEGILLKKILELGEGEVSEPLAVYAISGDFSYFVRAIAGKTERRDWSKEMTDYTHKRTRMQFPMMWNEKIGCDETEMAAVNLLLTQTAFVSSDFEENCIYVFCFSNSYPVAVSFEKENGNAVLATAYYVFDKNYPKNLQNIFSNHTEIGITVEQVQ